MSTNDIQPPGGKDALLTAKPVEQSPAGPVQTLATNYGTAASMAGMAPSPAMTKAAPVDSAFLAAAPVQVIPSTQDDAPSPAWVKSQGMVSHLEDHSPSAAWLKGVGVEGGPAGSRLTARDGTGRIAQATQRAKGLPGIQPTNRHGGEISPPVGSDQSGSDRVAQQSITPIDDPTWVQTELQAERCGDCRAQAAQVQFGSFEFFGVVGGIPDIDPGVLPRGDGVQWANGTGLFERVYYPISPCEIARAILDAESANPPRTIRAVGSGWSFSDAALPHTHQTDPNPFPLWSNEAGDEYDADAVYLVARYGYIVQSTSFAKSLQSTLPGLLAADQPELNEFGGEYFHVEAGIILSELNTLLDHEDPPMALSTMGGSAGQTLAGLLATGSHGGDFERPPLADAVRAIYLIGQGGVHYWIEPTSLTEDPDADPDTTSSGDGQRGIITDSKAKILAAFPCLLEGNIIYNNAVFDAVLVSMGAMGIVYSVILKVGPQYCLAQANHHFPRWNDVVDRGGPSPTLNRAMDGSLTGILDRYYHSKGDSSWVPVITQTGPGGGTHQVANQSFAVRVGDVAPIVTAADGIARSTRYLAIQINPMPQLTPTAERIPGYGTDPYAAIIAGGVGAPGSFDHKTIVLNRAEVPVSSAPFGRPQPDIVQVALGLLPALAPDFHNVNLVDFLLAPLFPGASVHPDTLVNDITNVFGDLSQGIQLVTNVVSSFSNPLGAGGIGGIVRAILAHAEQAGNADLVTSVSNYLFNYTTPEGGGPVYSPADQTNPPLVNRVDVGHKIMDGGMGPLGNPGDGGSMEGAFSMSDAIAFIDDLLKFFDGLALGEFVMEGEGLAVAPPPRWNNTELAPGQWQRLVNYGVQRSPVYPAGYVSLRACGQTRGTMGIEQWPLTATVEVALLADTHVTLAAYFKYIENLALTHNGNLHWGQACELANAANLKPSLGSRTSRQTLFRNARWRLCGRAEPSTFNNRFTYTRGLSNFPGTDAASLDDQT